MMKATIPRPPVSFSSRETRNIVFTLFSLWFATAAIAQVPADGTRPDGGPAASPPAATNATANPARRAGAGGFGFLAWTAPAIGAASDDIRLKLRMTVKAR